MIDAWVNWAERRLFSHYNSVRADRHHGASAVGFHWHDELQLITEHPNQIKQTPGGHSITAPRIQDQAYPLRDADRVQMIDKVIQNLLMNDCLLPRPVAGHVQQRATVAHLLDLREKFLPVPSSHAASLNDPPQ